jgi:hypothetical protein
MHNARYVYEHSWALIPEDRSAIGAVQKAFRDSGKYMVVNNPEEAEMIVVVQSRPSEDILAVYNAHTWGQETYIWRAMEKNGLSSPGVPLYQQLTAALEELDRVR